MATKDLTVRILGDASNFNKALNGIGNSASVTGAKLTKNLTPAAAAVGLAMGKIGSSFNDARDAIIVGTGASGKALDGLMATSKKVAGRVPNDFGQVGQAIADVNTRLGLTGPELETVSKKALDLSRITKTDVSTNIRAAARVTRDWGLEATEAADVMDMMFKASQSTGIGFDRLGDTVVQFGAPLRAFGFSMEESVALLAEFEAQGVNTEAIMSGLRQGLGRIARAGEDPIDVLARVSEEIKNAGSAGEANALALEVFGSRAGPDMAAAIREGRFEIDDLIATLGDSEGSIDSAAEGTLRFSDRLNMLKNRIIGVLGPFGEFGGVAGGAVAALGPLIFGLGQMAPLLGKVRKAMIALKVAMVGHPLMLLATVAATVGSAFILLRDRADDVTQSIDDMADAMRNAETAGEGLADWIAKTVGETDILLRTFDKAGVTIDEVADAAMAGGEAWNDMAMRLAKASRDIAPSDADQQRLREFFEEIRENVPEAVARYEALGRVHGETADAIDGTTDATEDNTDATDDATESQEDYAEALRFSADALDDQYESLTNLIEAQSESVESTYAVEDAFWALFEANKTSNEAFAEATEGTKEWFDAQQEAIDAADAFAAAKLAEAEATATANGETLTATERADNQTDALLDSAAAMTGPARRAVLGHIQRLNDIPDDVMTLIEAALERDDIDEAERLINETSRTRKVAIEADAVYADLVAAEIQLNNLARARTSTIRTSVKHGSLGSSDYTQPGFGTTRAPETHSGGVVKGGIQSFAGLRPDEVPAILQKGEAVLTPEQQGAMLGAGRGGGGPQVITINNYSADPEQVVKALQKFVRRNGPGSVPL